MNAKIHRPLKYFRWDMLGILAAERLETIRRARDRLHWVKRASIRHLPDHTVRMTVGIARDHYDRMLAEHGTPAAARIAADLAILDAEMWLQQVHAPEIELASAPFSPLPPRGAPRTYTVIWSINDTLIAFDTVKAGVGPLRDVRIALIGKRKDRSVKLSVTLPELLDGWARRCLRRQSTGTAVWGAIMRANHRLKQMRRTHPMPASPDWEPSS